MADWTSALPGPRSPRVKDGPHVPIYTTLSHLLVEWRGDSQKLATAAVAMNLYGHWSGSIVFSVATSGQPRADGTWIKSITETEAIELLERAFFRKNRLRLLHRGEGLLWALEAFAGDVDFARLHRTREDACVIECRELGIEERVAKLRERRPVCVPVEDEVDV